MSYETVRRLLRLQRNDDVGLLVKYDRKEKIDPSDVAVDVEIRDDGWNTLVNGGANTTTRPKKQGRITQLLFTESKVSEILLIIWTGLANAHMYEVLNHQKYDFLTKMTSKNVCIRKLYCDMK